MDEKYIDNLDGSNYVDEGMWDRLKSRAAGFTQAAKNISGRNVGDVEQKKFEALFDRFSQRTLKILLDLNNVIQPYISSNRMSPDELAELEKFDDLKTALSQVKRGKISEANLFNRPFSVIGAMASGSPQVIMNAYKKLVESYYNSFIEDAKKLNIVPDNYILRKIGSLNPKIPEVLSKLGVVLGRNLTATIPAAASTEPVSPSPSPITTPTPPPIPTPTPKSPVAPVSGKTPESPIASSKSSSGISPEDSKKMQGYRIVYDLINESLKKLVDTLLKGGKVDSPEESSLTRTPMLDKIRGGIAREASKAEAVFPKENPIQITIPATSTTPKTIIRWNLRFKVDKEEDKFLIQYIPIRIESLPGKKPSISRHGKWENLLSFDVLDVSNEKGYPNPTFDVYKEIEKTNPELGTIIQKVKKIIGKTPDESELNWKIVNALRNVVISSRPDTERGVRNLSTGEPDVEEEPTSTEPEEAPEIPSEIRPSEPMVKPERHSREIKTGETPKLNSDGSITLGDKSWKWNQAKPSSVLKALSPEDLTRLKQIIALKKKSPVSESFEYKNFFPL